MSLAPRKFWIDGGYDSDEVVHCEFWPEHRWWTFWLSEVLVPTAFGRDEQMVICQGCFVPRCGHADERDPCLMPRHHRTEHVTASGQHEPVGGWGIGAADR